MAQKINPVGLRLGINKTWASQWYAPKSEYSKLLHEDLKIRNLITKKIRSAGIDRIEIRRNQTILNIDIYVGRPGIVIGRGGSGIEQLKKDLVDAIGKQVKIDIHEVKQPLLSAALVCQTVVEGLEKKVSPKILMSQQIEKVGAAGAKGARIWIAGIGPKKQTRTLKVELKGGSVPLTTLRADIDYAKSDAQAIGYNQPRLGVKVWIYKGEKATI